LHRLQRNAEHGQCRRCAVPPLHRRCRCHACHCVSTSHVGPHSMRQLCSVPTTAPQFVPVATWCPWVRHSGASLPGPALQTSFGGCWAHGGPPQCLAATASTVCRGAGLGYGARQVSDGGSVGQKKPSRHPPHPPTTVAGRASSCKPCQEFPTASHSRVYPTYSTLLHH